MQNTTHKRNNIVQSQNKHTKQNTNAKLKHTNTKTKYKTNTATHVAKPTTYGTRASLQSKEQTYRTKGKLQGQTTHTPMKQTSHETRVRTQNAQNRNQATKQKHICNTKTNLWDENTHARLDNR